ncbi:hypothetical protein [Pseudomonas sp.]|uniref:hypothetical protein n=1 Tax=Pseudomonas sp. TaxID=306 RepID=UPI003A969695
MSTAFGVAAAPGQTTGQRVGGIIGAVIGAYAGGPAGAFYGYQISADIPGALDPSFDQLDQEAVFKHLSKGASQA